MKSAYVVFALAGLLAMGGLATATPALIHHWMLDDAANWGAEGWDSSQSPIWDSASNAYNAFVIPSADFGELGAASHTGSSIKFGGRFNRAHLGDVAPGTDPFTISLWFKTDTWVGLGPGGGQDHIISGNDDKDVQAGRWNLHTIEGGHGLQFFHHGYGAYVITNDLELNQWYHVAIARCDAVEENFNIYVDGMLLHTGTNHASLTNTDQGVWLARRPNFGTSAFNGWIDDVRFYDDAVSADYINSLLIPEPATLVVLGLGGLLAARRRR